MAPFELGTPLRLGSKATACLSDRARALTAASALWWSLLPYSTNTWTFDLKRGGEGFEEVHYVFGRHVLYFFASEFKVNFKVWSLHRSTAANAKEQSIGAAALPKRVMPSRVPNALFNASPKPMAKSSTKWCTKSPFTDAVMSIRLWVARKLSCGQGKARLWPR